MNVPSGFKVVGTLFAENKVLIHSVRIVCNGIYLETEFVGLQTFGISVLICKSVIICDLVQFFIVAQVGIV